MEILDEIKKIANKYNCRCFPYSIKYPQYVEVIQIIPHDETFNYDSLLLYIHPDNTFDYQIAVHHKYKMLTNSNYPLTLEQINLIVNQFFQRTKYNTLRNKLIQRNKRKRNKR